MIPQAQRTFANSKTKMSSIEPLPQIFQTSYLQHGDYPQNLIQKTIGTYPSALKEYTSKLDHAADDLCEKDVCQVDVTIRDLKADDGEGAGTSAWHNVLPQACI